MGYVEQPLLGRVGLIKKKKQQTNTASLFMRSVIKLEAMILQYCG